MNMIEDRIIPLYERQPHVTIDCGDEIHIYPLSYFRSLIAGEPPMEKLPDKVLRAIVRNWLSFIEHDPD